MKTYRYLFLSIALFACISVAAHAPKKVSVEYDGQAGKLNVSITHPVKDVSDHYIESVVISINGEEVKTVKYTEQSSKNSEDVSIHLPGLKAGDEISLVATCNKFGSKTGTTIVK